MRFSPEFFIVLSFGVEWDFSHSEIGLAIIYVEVVDVGFWACHPIMIMNVPSVICTCHGLV